MQTGAASLMRTDKMELELAQTSGQSAFDTSEAALANLEWWERWHGIATLLPEIQSQLDDAERVGTR